MPIQKVPLEALQKIRRHLQNALMLPKSESSPRSPTAFEADSELPEPDSLSDLNSLFNFGAEEFENHAPNAKGAWFISSTNPGAVLVKLPGVKLKPGLRLVSYLNRSLEGGVGVTWAVPEAFSTTAQLEEALSRDNLSLQCPPHPQAALSHVMEAIEGDRSPLSFMITSLLQREWREFGAAGKFCNWSHHRLISAVPTGARWQWRVTSQDLSPKVLVYPDQKVAIEFFTCRVTAPIAIFQHVDQYPATSYKLTSKERPIAIPDASPSRA